MNRHILIFICCLLLSYSPLHAQRLRNPIPASYDEELQRLLVTSTGTYLYASSYGQLDKDSAMIFAAITYGLNRLMPYNEGYKSGKDFPGSALINAGNIPQAIQVLATTHGVPRLQLLAELTNYYIHRPGSNKGDLDQAQKYVQLLHQESTASKDTFWRVQSYWLLGALSAERGNFPEGQQHFKKAVTLCRELHNDRLLALSLVHQADGLPTGTPQKEGYFQEAIAIAKKMKQPALQCLIMGSSIPEHFRISPLNVTKEEHELITLSETIGFKHLQYANATLSFLYMTVADIPHGLEYALRSIENMEATKDTVLSPIFCMYVSLQYGNIGKLETALQWNDRAVSVPLTKETQVLWYKAYLTRISLLRLMKRYDEAFSVVEKLNRQYPPETEFHKMMLASETAYVYEAAGNSELALAHYLKFLDIADRFPPQLTYSEKLKAYTSTAGFYIKQGKLTLARKYATFAAAHPYAKESVVDQGRIHWLLFKLDSAAGDYASATKNLLIHHRYMDSVYSHTQRKAIDALTVQYETQQKDRDIRILKQDTQLQKARLSRAAITGGITLAGLVLLLVIIGLLYNQYRIKRKAGMDTLSRNTVLQQILEEKEWLLREVHHRVKNNLQTIVSLLESQSAYLQNEALLAIQESQNRIHAMSLIHQKLYHNSNVSSVNMGAYLPELIQYLRQSYNLKNNVCVTVQVDETELDVSQAIPLGLIVNEAVTNAIKYAFPQPTAGHTISIGFIVDGDHAQLHIADNGIGIGPEILQAKVRGLGLKLIRGLARDIEATLEINGENGTAITISFEITRPLNSASGESAAVSIV